MRVRYQQRRLTLLAALACVLPAWRPSAAEGGLHTTVFLPREVDEPALLAAAARHGVGIEGLSLHSYSSDCPAGLVMGHAFMAPPAIERGVQLLAGVLEDVASART